MKQEMYTVAETGFLVDRPTVEVQRAVDKKVITPVSKGRGGRKQQLFGKAELRFLKVDPSLGNALSPEGRKLLYKEFSRLPDAAKVATIGVIAVDIRKTDSELKERMKMLQDAKRAIESRGGKSFIKGTDVMTYQIAALSSRLSVDQVLEDFPSLTRSQVQAAINYARAYPKPGRPFPSTTMKRGLAAMVAAGVFDEADDEDRDGNA